MPASNLQGILAMLAAVAVFSIMDASMKQLALTYPPLQVSCLRGLASLPFMLLAVACFGRWRDLIPRRWIQHALRGCLAIGMLTAFVYSVKILPLAEAYAIFLCAPLIVTALSVWLLRESVGWHRWLAIGVGMVGVLTILRPNMSQANGSHLATLGAIAALGAALCYALGIIMIRKLARTETTLSIGFSFMVIVAIATGALAVPTWTPLQAAHWPWIATLGLSGSLGQLLIIEAFRKAPASVIAPFEYTALLWGLALDWILWNTTPSQRTLVGGGIVAVSGLYVIYREHVTRLIRDSP